MTRCKPRATTLGGHSSASAWRLRALVLVAPVLLCACGGGEPATSARAADASADTRRSALADLTLAELTTLFDWAEYKFPSLFPKPSNRWAQPFAFGGETFWVSAYAVAGGYGNFLGITPDGRVFGHGNFVGVYDAAVFIGNASEYSALVSADRCSVYPTATGCANPPGTVNECILPASQALRAGNRITFSYTRTTYEGGLPADSKEYPVDLLVEGLGTFEGQQVHRTVITTTAPVVNLVNGSPVTLELDAKAVTYSQVGPGDVLLTLGRDEQGYRGTNLLADRKSTFSPARLEREFTLRPGESATIVESGSRRVAAEFPATDLPLPRVEEFSTSRTYTFEARETLTIGGKPYDTCRYRVNTQCEGGAPGTACLTWFLVGKGIPMVRESYNGTSLLERSVFKSGTFLGVAI